MSTEESNDRLLDEMSKIINYVERQIESERQQKAREKFLSLFTLNDLRRITAKLDPPSREEMYRRHPELRPKP